jgi:hypothetical protein
LLKDKRVPWLFEPIRDKFSSVKGKESKIFATPISSEFNQFILYKESDLFEQYWNFAALINFFVDHVPKEEMEICRKLKNMECELYWKGILNRKPFFRSLSNLKVLKKYIPKISLDSNLFTLLNNNKELMYLIQKVKPEEITIHFPLYPLSYPLSSLSAEKKLEIMIESYKNPFALHGMFTLRMMISKGPNVDKSKVS